MTRPLLAAFLIALAVHVAAITAVGIVTPEGPGRSKPYGKVDFLGPILGKTAFDLMLEEAGPDRYTFYMQSPDAAAEDLRVPPPRAAASERAVVYGGFAAVDRDIEDFLSGERPVPDILDGGYPGLAGIMDDEGRKCVHRPEAPSVPKEIYGGKRRFKVIVDAVVSAEGRVLRAETVTTTGYPQVDIMASKYVESWIYAPRAKRGPDDTGDRVEVELELGGGE